MKKSFDRARMKFMRKHRKDWNPTKRMLEQLNSSQALDYQSPKVRSSLIKALPPLEPQDYED